MSGIRPLDRSPAGVVDLNVGSLGRDLPATPEFGQQVASDIRVITGIEIDSHRPGQEELKPGQTLQRGPQQWGIVPVRSSQNDSDRQAVAFDERGPLLPGFATIGWVRSGVVTTAGSLHTAIINAQVSQVRADYLVEGLEHDPLEADEHTVGDPFITAGQ